jgi:hypothetical protein
MNSKARTERPAVDREISWSPSRNVKFFDRGRSEDRKINMVSLSVNQKIIIRHRTAFKS